MEEQTRSADAQEEEPWDEDEELRKVSVPTAPCPHPETKTGFGVPRLPAATPHLT
jgi:hypothetical protein